MVQHAELLIDRRGENLARAWRAFAAKRDQLERLLTVGPMDDHDNLLVATGLQLLLEQLDHDRVERYVAGERDE